MDNILTPHQKSTLSAITNSSLATSFYFTGGTALSHYYLQHRFSEDLDFFCVNEFDINDISVVLRSLKSKIGYEALSVESSFNRFPYQLHFPDGSILKVEFTYFPFPQIEKPLKKAGLKVDSVLDIATNKLFTIAQKPRGRDYFDLYFIVQKYDFSLEMLRQKAKIKFDWHVDPLQLGSQLMKVDELLDDPILEKKVNRKIVINFFSEEAKKLSPEILE